MWCGAEVLFFFGLLSVSQIYFSWFYTDNASTSDKSLDNGTVVPMLCYFGMASNWPDNGTLHPALNATLCSHLIFIPTTIQDCQIALSNADDGNKYFSKIPLLRHQNPKLKLLVSNGGGSSNAFTPVLASATNRSRYIASIIPFLKRYDLDGLDMDWEFPGWPPLPREQRKNFTMLLQEIRDVFDDAARSGGKKYLLSAAVAAGRSLMEIYDIPALNKSLDFINLMCYDLHTYRSTTPWTGYNSPLYPNDWWKKIVITGGNVGWSSYEWHRRGMAKSKIMVGLPTYMHSFTLEKADRYHGLYAPATGPGKGDGGGYPYVCDFLKSDATEMFDEDAYVPYAFKGDQWVSYDNVRSLTGKVSWIIAQKFGGVMVFDTNSDDVSNICGQGKFPLISAMRDAINNATTTKSIS